MFRFPLSFSSITPTYFDSGPCSFITSKCKITNFYLLLIKRKNSTKPHYAISNVIDQRLLCASARRQLKYSAKLLSI